MSTPGGQQEAWAEAHWRSARRMLQVAEPGWAAVATFYTALKLLHAWLLTTKSAEFITPPDRHTGAGGNYELVRRYLRPVQAEYWRLFTASVDVRYHGDQPSDAIVGGLITDALEPFAQCICSGIHPQPCDCWMRRIT